MWDNDIKNKNFILLKHFNWSTLLYIKHYIKYSLFSWYYPIVFDIRNRMFKLFIQYIPYPYSIIIKINISQAIFTKYETDTFQLNKMN